MKIDIDQLHDFKNRGVLQPYFGWGDAEETACLMSALTSETSTEGCAAQGWPVWLAELGTVIFDNAGDLWWERSVAFAEAVRAAEGRGADFDQVFRDVRLSAILPIAMESIGDGDEPWRAQCREAVQWSMDHEGKAKEAEEAAGAAEAEGAAEAAEAAKAAWAAGAAEAAGAAGVAEAAWAAGAAAHTRIFEATIAALRGDKGAGRAFERT